MWIGTLYYNGSLSVVLIAFVLNGKGSLRIDINCRVQGDGYCRSGVALFEEFQIKIDSHTESGQPRRLDEQLW